jgi:hypothetical protein
MKQAKPIKQGNRGKKTTESQGIVIENVDVLQTSSRIER